MAPRASLWAAARYSLADMRLNSSVSVEYVIAAFLHAELQSPRWGKYYDEGISANGFDRSIVESPQLENPVENDARRTLLRWVRGYPDERLFIRFPNDVSWCTGVADAQDIASFRYGNYDDWVALSNHTGLVGEAAKTLDRDDLVTKVNVAQVRGDAEAIRRGGLTDPVIVVSRAADTPMVILDGCCRTTALALAGTDGPATVEVILGISPSMVDWYWWPPGL